MRTWTLLTEKPKYFAPRAANTDRLAPCGELQMCVEICLHYSACTVSQQLDSGHTTSWHSVILSDRFSFMIYVFYFRLEIVSIHYPQVKEINYSTSCAVDHPVLSFHSPFLDKQIVLLQ